MYCSQCGTQNVEDASYCTRCGSPLSDALRPTRDPLASMGLRAVSYIVDGILQGIPFLGLIPLVINGIMYRRGQTIGLKLIGARIVRDNGELSGFYHTVVRAAAAGLSAIPLGLGYWWAFWDPERQAWHDKLLRTYVMRDSPELAERPGTSSHAAVVWFWVLLIGSFVLFFLFVILVITTMP